MHVDHQAFRDHPQFSQAVRRDGWTPRLKGRFLMILAETGNARLSARRCGLSVQSAYVQRRRDARFALAWEGALVHALRHGEDVLADRALDGIEEPVFYRGEQVGTRTRYDNRLLLAHLARLDKRAAHADAVEAAARFDEMVALVAGTPMPETLDATSEAIPADRYEHSEAVGEGAEEALRHEFEEEGKDADEPAIAAAGRAARTAADQEWDGWVAQAWAIADGVTAGGEGAEDADLGALDRVNGSTSGASDGPGHSPLRALGDEDGVRPGEPGPEARR